MPISPKLSQLTSSMLRTAQRQARALTVNVASLENPDASRIRAHQGPLIDPRTGKSLGVQILSVKRLTDEALNVQSAAARSLRELRQSRADMQNRIEHLWGTADNEDSLVLKLNRFHKQIELETANGPDHFAPTRVVDRAENFAFGVQEMAQSICRLRQESDQKISTAVDTLNHLLKEYQEVNEQIVRTSARNGSGSPPYAAMDARDALYRQISEFVPVHQSPQKDGSCILRLKTGALLVQGDYCAEFRFQSSPTVSPGQNLDPVLLSTMDGGDVNVSVLLSDEQRVGVVSGALAGLIKARDVDLVRCEQHLDQWAAMVRDEFNAVHNKGVSAAGGRSILTSKVFSCADVQNYDFRGQIRISIMIGETLDQQAFFDVPILKEFRGSVRDAGFEHSINNAKSPQDDQLSNYITARWTLDDRLVLESLDPAHKIMIHDTPNRMPFEVHTDRGFSHFMGFNDFFVDPHIGHDGPLVRAQGAAFNLTVEPEIRENSMLLAQASPQADGMVGRGDISHLVKLSQVFTETHQFLPTGGFHAPREMSLEKWGGDCLVYSAFQAQKLKRMYDDACREFDRAEEARLGVSAVQDGELFMEMSHLAAYNEMSVALATWAKQLHMQLLKLFD